MPSFLKSRKLNPVRSGAFLLAGTMLAAGLATALLAQEVKQPWIAPASASAVKNPLKPSAAANTEAEQVFQQNCAICHGRTGASNGPAAGSLPEKPANFTDTEMMKKASDGELFWKMTNGRAPMPSWQDRLSETQRWELVNYLRELTRKGQYKYLGIGKGTKS